MARVNVYLPDDLAAEARQAGVNVSQVTQQALRRELSQQQTSEWLHMVRKLVDTKVRHDRVIAALDAVREQMGTRNAQ